MFKNGKQKSMFGKGMLSEHQPMFGKVMVCLASGSSIFSGMSGAYTDVLKDLYLNVGQYLESLFYNYSTGNIEEVAETLTREYYETLAVKLYKERQPNKEYYEGIRLIINRALEGLNKSILEHAELLRTLTQLEECKEKADILNDRDKLNEYINELNKSSGTQRHVFGAQSVTTIAAVLKPKYARYLELYGFPECGVFDVDKMAAICEELERENNNGEPENIVIVNNNPDDEDC